MQRIMVKNKTSAFDSALRFLGYRALSRKELTEKLSRKGYGSEEIKSVLERLETLHYVDDHSLADEVFACYKKAGGYGNLYIFRKMKLRGLCCTSRLSYEEEVERARILTEKKRSAMERSGRVLQKAASLLSRRGYEASVIAAVLEQEKERQEHF